MDFTEALNSRIKPELNHIYTEPPFMVLTGWDWGWFCREHALHLYGLAALFGQAAEICVGDYILSLPNGDPLFQSRESFFSSVADDADHAWCRIDGAAPVDLSISVKHLFRGVSEVGLVCSDQPAYCEPLELQYRIKCPDDEFLELVEGIRPLIAYNEKKSYRFDPSDLMSNPYQFLFPPPLGFSRFTDIHGPDVFHAITLHCYHLATTEAKPLGSYLDPKRTVKAILKRSPDARELVEQRLAEIKHSSPLL